MSGLVDALDSFGSFRVDNIAERISNEEKYYGFPLADAPFFVPFVDFRRERHRGRQRSNYHVGLVYLGQDSFEMTTFYAFKVNDDNDAPFKLNDEWVYISELQQLFEKDGDGRNEITFKVHFRIHSDDLKPQDHWRRSESKDSNLGEDLLKFFVDAPGSDLTIVVGGGEHQKSFKTHKGFLMARSEYFRAFFESGMKDSRQDMLTFEDLDPQTFEHFLKFLYTGVRPELKLNEARKLWVVANRFLSTKLEKMSEGAIVQELHHEVQLRPANAASAIIEHLKFANDFNLWLLFKSCQLYVKGSLRVIGATEEWREFEREHPELVAQVLQSESAE